MELAGLAKQSIVIALVALIVLGFGVVPATRTANEPKAPISPFESNYPTENYRTISQFYNALKDNAAPKYDVLTITSSPTILRNIRDPVNTTYIAIGIEKRYNEAEVLALADFYRAGGKLIIADDFGFAQDLSSDPTFQVNYFQETLLDRTFDLNISFPIIYGRVAVGDEYLIELDKPTALHVAPDLLNESKKRAGHPRATILANSSRDSFVDRNGDGAIDIEDAAGPFPVVAMVQPWPGKGQAEEDLGKAVFASDPGIFMNEMWERGGEQVQVPGLGANYINRGNNEFVMALMKSKLMPNPGVVLFDESRHQQKAYSEAIYGGLRTVSIMTSDWREIALLLTGMIIILGIVVWKARDEEDWVHRYDIGTIKRRGELTEDPKAVQDRLRIAVMKKVRQIYSMGAEEISSMTPPQIANMIKDQSLNELVLNPMRDFSVDELRMLTDRLRKWEK